MRNNKKVLVVLGLLLLVASVMHYTAFAGTDSQSGLIDQPYQYPLELGSDEWKARDVAELMILSEVPEGLAERMTTDALIETVLSYPFLVNIYLAESVDEGIQRMSESMEPLNELLSRSDALTELQDYLLTFEEIDDVDKPFEYYAARQMVAFILRHNEPARYTIDPITGFPVTWVYTPNNHPVKVFVDLSYSDHQTTQTEANNATLTAASVYNATIVSSADPAYNCHSYAWYSTNYLNPYWMNNPSDYMEDGSYHKQTVAASGYRVTYKFSNDKIDHSGIIYSVGSTTYVTAKWGYLGVLRNALTDNPYYWFDGATNIEYWN